MPIDNHIAFVVCHFQSENEGSSHFEEKYYALWYGLVNNASSVQRQKGLSIHLKQ